MRHPKLMAAVLLALPTWLAQAADFEYGVEIGVGNSDNIGRVPVDEESETIMTAGVDLRLLREGTRFTADVDVDLDYLDYQDETFDSEVTGLANADLRYGIVPGRFDWTLIENFGQAQLDPFAASTPDNRENVNYLTTGPDFTIRMGSLASLTLFGRYSTTDFEDSNFDDERLLGGIQVGRQLSARSEISLNVMTETVEFDDETVASDYDRNTAYLRYDVEGSRTRVGIEAGYTEIRGDEETTETPLFELDVERDVSERSTLTLLAGIRSSDTATSMRTGGDLGNGGPTSPGQISASDTFETQHATAGWQFRTPRTQFNLGAGWEDDSYDNQEGLDREREFFRASASRQITPRITLRAQASLFSSTFEATEQEDDELQYGLLLSWNAVGRLYIELDADHFERDSSNSLTDFDENRYFLRFAWRNAGTGGASGAR